MSVAGTCHILRRRPVLDSQDSFSDHLTGVSTDDVSPQDTVGLGIRNDLDQSFVVVCTEYVNSRKRNDVGN